MLGGQAAVGLMVPFGPQHRLRRCDADGRALGPIGFTVSGSRTTGERFRRFVPTCSLRWNRGVDNWMVYITGDIPVGAYDSKRLANLGIGHGAIDGGAGYTYFNPATGQEFSAVLGFTYNFENPSTQYQNGVDMHLDMGVVAVPYQAGAGRPGRLCLQADLVRQRERATGSAASSRRCSVSGRSSACIFPLGELQGYLNLKGYKEFGAEHRPEGWNAWLTFVLSPAPPTAAPPKPRITKAR